MFAASDEGLLPGPLAALSLGGIWNAEVVPATRLGFLAVVSLVVVGALVVLGVRAQRRTPGAGFVGARRRAGASAWGWRS